jgi:histone H3/H4
MAKKPKVNKDIREAGKAVAELMKEHLTEIAHDMIQQVMNKYKTIAESQNSKPFRDCLLEE